MGEHKDYMTHADELGCIHISEEVLASIAAGAVVEVEGISGLMNAGGKKSNGKSVRLTMEEDGAVVDVYVMIRYGYAIPEVAENAQKAVVSAVEAMTGCGVSAVNIHVGGVTLA